MEDSKRKNLTLRITPYYSTTSSNTDCRQAPLPLHLDSHRQALPNVKVWRGSHLPQSWAYTQSSQAAREDEIPDSRNRETVQRGKRHAQQHKVNVLWVALVLSMQGLSKSGLAVKESLLLILQQKLQ